MTTRSFAIKTAIPRPRARTFEFNAQKTMYGGKQVAVGDAVFLFASENEGGKGLVARGVITSAKPTPRKPGIARQTPRVSITVRRTALATRPLGRVPPVVLIHDVWCRPCMLRECPIDHRCMRGITVDRVLAAARQAP